VDSRATGFASSGVPRGGSTKDRAERSVRGSPVPTWEDAVGLVRRTYRPPCTRVARRRSGSLSTVT
jgi:hypothetical protein